MSHQRMEYAGGVIKVDSNIILNPIALNLEVNKTPDRVCVSLYGIIIQASRLESRSTSAHTVPSAHRKLTLRSPLFAGGKA